MLKNSFEDRVYKALQPVKELKEVLDYWIDFDDLNAGEPVLHVHIELDQELMEKEQK